jgi:hypothetical protein
VKARCVADVHEIAACHAEGALLDPPEIRHVDPTAQYFNAWRKSSTALPCFLFEAN